MPTPGLETSLPSVGARVLAFTVILLSGAAGGAIGVAMADVGCTGSCGAARGLLAMIGAWLCAAGVAVVTVLTLRAFGEWDVMQRRNHPGSTTPPDTTPPGTTPPGTTPPDPNRNPAR